MRRWTILGTLFVMLFAVSGCGQAAVSSKGNGQPPSKAEGNPSPARTTTNPSSSPRPREGILKTAILTLPVHALPTTFGVEGHIVVPRTLTVRVPAAWAKAVGAYWSGQVFLGPAGWRGTGQIGADGSEGIVLYPPGGSMSSGPRISITGNGGCVGCGAPNAAAFFDAIRNNWSRYQVIPGPPPPKVQVQSEVYLGPNVIAYQLRNTPGGLEVNGVAYTGLIGGAGGLSFETMQTYLPPRQHDLASVILNFYLKNDLP